MRPADEIRTIALQEAVKILPHLFSACPANAVTVLDLAKKFENHITGVDEEKDRTNKLIALAARTAHEVNRELQIFLGEKVISPLWDSASREMRNSAFEGVKLILNNPNTTPEQSHESWLDFKTKHGWSYAAERDDESKLHPCMVPYYDLPPEQRLKDAMFQTVVRSILFG